MPYISQARRLQLDGAIAMLSGAMMDSPGELNYVITKLCVAHARVAPNYAVHNAVIGALECAKLEYYRRVIAPYESAKIAENGDVYGL